MATGGYETFEHTADVGLHVWGGDMRELFQQAARGLIALLADPDTVRRGRSIVVAATGEEPEELLVSWLGEILYVAEVEGLVLCAAQVDAIGEHDVRGTVWGESPDAARHELRHHVKAVTYHDLRIEHRPTGGLETRIVFDV